jgi:hypothetical protein
MSAHRGLGRGLNLHPLQQVAAIAKKGPDLTSVAFSSSVRSDSTLFFALWLPFGCRASPAANRLAIEFPVSY